MGTMVNVNGVLRESSSLVNINGVLRKSKTLVNINGVLRDVSNHLNDITEEDIDSFILIYHVNKNPSHPDFPSLKYNPNIPASIKLTGETPGVCNLEYKGVIFEYDRINFKEEGILMYTGHLYAVLTDGTPIDICCFNNPQDINGMQVFETGDDISNLKIQIQATLIYESNGYYIAGWNSLFSSIQFIDPTRYPEDEKRGFHYMNSYPILPVIDRLDEYNPLAQIGIARSTTNDGLNMNGSYGVLDQTIHWITVNEVKKPFVIEVYN